MLRITVVGPGRLGGALALALSKTGFATIDSFIYRGRRPPRSLLARLVPVPVSVRFDRIKAIDSQVILITTQDEELSEAAAGLRGKVGAGTVVLHTSGSVSSAVLSGLRSEGCHIGSLHPLASITGWRDGESLFRGAYFCVEGDKAALNVGKNLAKSLGGITFTIETSKKPLYHAAALTAAGQVTALFDIAVGLMVQAGVSRTAARRMLQPLLSGVAGHLSGKDAPDALTGTYARADERTVESHLDALADNASKDEMLVYIELALRSCRLAERRGVDPVRIRRIRKRLRMAKAQFEC
jgi:predicted short-subunit dehydrogenase-like oxidoreductase (DUF2520 family)